MCITAKKFTEQGFEVSRVHLAQKTPLVEVSDIPKKHILKRFHTITEIQNGVRRELKVGYWLGCHVALVQKSTVQ